MNTVKIDRSTVRHQKPPPKFMPTGYVEEIRDAAGNVIGYRRETFDTSTMTGDYCPFTYRYIHQPLICQECGHSCFERDIEETEYGDLPCPQCGEFIDVEYEDLPHVVLKRLADENAGAE